MSDNEEYRANEVLIPLDSTERTERIVSKDTEEKLDILTEKMNEFAELISPAGQPNIFAMKTQSDSLRQKANEINDGIFNLLVMGTFKNGKSTLINSIVGSEFMATAATECTSVITVVEQGDSPVVTVFFTDLDRKPESITREQYRETYKITEQDRQDYELTKTFPRFEDIDHVLMYSSHDLFSGGLRLIDSPGLEASNATEKITLDYLGKANAIIYTINSTAAFSGNHDHFIKSISKSPEHVFFVFTKFDKLNEPADEENVRALAKEKLLPIYGGNEALYSKRVFFTNAYEAFMFRAGKPIEFKQGSRRLTRPAEIEGTGILEFETALKDFLNSSQRIQSLYSNIIAEIDEKLLPTAKLQAEQRKEAMNLSLGELERNIKISNSEIEKAGKNVEEMRSRIDSHISLMIKTVRAELADFVNTKVTNAYESAVAKKADDVDFGGWDMASVGFTRLTGAVQSGFHNIAAGINRLTGHAADARYASDKARQAEEAAMKTIRQKLSPITSFVEREIKKTVEDWADADLAEIIRKEDDSFRSSFQRKIDDFNINISNAISAITNVKAQSPVAAKGGGMQTAISLIAFGDYSLAAEIAAFGGKDIEEYVVRTIVQIVIGTVVFSIGGWWLFLVVEVIQLGMRAQSQKAKLLETAGKKSIEQLRKDLQESDKISRKITDVYAPIRKKILGDALGILSDLSERNNALLEERGRTQQENEAKTRRIEQSIADMEGIFGKLREIKDSLVSE